ncbi:MAG: hypothetical protein V4507_11310 [Verrucomicrobiota bacterium]
MIPRKRSTLLVGVDSTISVPANRGRSLNQNIVSIFKATYLFLFFLCSCHPHDSSVKKWASEREFTSEGIRAQLRLSKTTVTPGATLEVEIDLESPLGSSVQVSLSGLQNLDPMESLSLPVQLKGSEKELHPFRFTLQAGPPEKIPSQKIPIEFQQGSEKKNLSIEFPEIVIQSAFPSGKSNGQIPSLEEHDSP